MFVHELADPLRDVAVRGAVETVAADAVFLVGFVGEAVEEGVLGHGLVEGGVEDADLGHAGHEFGAGVDTEDVGRVVEGCEVDAFFEGIHDLRGDEDGVGEFLGAVDDAMSNGVDFLHVFEDAVLFVGEGIKDHFYADAVVFDVGFEDDFFFAGRLMG